MFAALAFVIYDAELKMYNLSFVKGSDPSEFYIISLMSQLDMKKIKIVCNNVIFSIF